MLLRFLFLAAVAAAQTSPIVSTVEPDFGADKDKPRIVLPTMLTFIVLPDGSPYYISGGAALPDPVVRALAKYRFQTAKDAYETTVFLKIPHVLDTYSGQTRSRPSLPPEVLKAADKIQAANVRKIETGLKPGPESAVERSALALFAAGQPGAEMLATRSRQLDWLIRNTPNSPLLKSSSATIARADEPEVYSDLKQRWIEALAQRPGEIGRLEAATNFLRVSDPEEVHRILLPYSQSAVQVQEWLGEAYAYASVGLASLGTKDSGPKFSTPGAFAAEARRQLEAADLPMLYSAFQAIGNLKFTAQAAKTALPDAFLPFCEFVRGRIRDHQPGAPVFCKPPTTGFSSSAPGSAPGPSAEPAGREYVSGGVTRGLILKQVRPSYPADAQARRIQGMVVLSATIGKNGKIASLGLLRGVLPLYASAYEAVRQWEYRPYLLDGQPVEVLTEIEVNYELR